MKFRPALLLMVAFVSLVGFSSCVRSYTCQCVISYSGQPGLPDTSIQEYTVKDTKKKAKKICEDNSSTSTQGGITTVENCHLY
ncbi:hypothetical protein ACTHGU_01075 [Chitinophagaceae bacterium MMS25-I14]